VRAAAAARGRDPGVLGFAKLQGISVHPDRAEAVARAERQWKSYYGPNYDVERSIILGSPAECGEKIAAYAEANSAEVTLALEPTAPPPPQLALILRSVEGTH